MERVKVSATKYRQSAQYLGHGSIRGSDMNAWRHSMPARNQAAPGVFRGRENTRWRKRISAFEQNGPHRGADPYWPELVMEAYLGRVSLSATGYYRHTQDTTMTARRPVAGFPVLWPTEPLFPKSKSIP